MILFESYNSVGFFACIPLALQKGMQNISKFGFIHQVIHVN